MTELAIPAEITPLPAGSLRLVEWAEEARAANLLAKSLCKTPFAGQFRNDEHAATAAILRGAEMGLTPVTALGAFDLIQGQPAPKAVTLRALVQSAGHKLDIIESTEEKAVARYRRSDDTDWQMCAFTIEDARKLGLVNKDNWKKQPRAMLEARVTSKAERLVAADMLLGIGYSSEELHDGDVQVARPQRVTASEILKAAPDPGEPDAVPDDTPEEQAAEAATEQGDDVCPGCGEEMHPPAECSAAADV